VSQTTETALVEEAERLLGGRTRDIRLSPALTRAFRDRSFKQTSKIIRSWMSWVVLLDILANATNLLLLPHEMALAMMPPSALIPPAAIAVYFIWAKRRPDMVLDYSLLLGLAVILVSVGLTGVAAGGEFQERYLSVMLFVAVSAIIIFNVPMQVTLLIALAGLSIYLVLQLLNPALSINSTLSAFFFFSSGVAAIGVARRTITLLAQRTFLLELRDARRAEELVEMNQRLDQLSKTDPLTGLPNRRYMEETLAALSSTPTDQSVQVAMLMCDIDYFKGLNDHLGHAEGDRCLVDVSQVIRKCLRPGLDHAARFGGEEFVVVLTDVLPEEGLAIAERIRLAIAALALANPGSPSGLVTISVGVAGAPLDSPARAARLMLAADEALYEAKHKGRNCVVLNKTLPPAGRAVA